MRQEWKPFSVKIPRLCPFSWLGPRFSSLPGFRGMPRLPVFRSFTSRPTAGIRKIESRCKSSESRYWIWRCGSYRIPQGSVLFSSSRFYGYSPRIYFFLLLLLSPFLFFFLFIGDREIVTILTYWDSPPFPFQIRRESIFLVRMEHAFAIGKISLNPPPLRQPRESSALAKIRAVFEIHL